MLYEELLLAVEMVRKTNAHQEPLHEHAQASWKELEQSSRGAGCKETQNLHQNSRRLAAETWAVESCRPSQRRHPSSGTDLNSAEDIQTNILPAQSIMRQVQV